MANLFQCQNSFICIEAFVEFICTLILLFMFIYGYRLIKIDKEITTNTDRIMYLISMFSVLMEVIYYLILDDDALLTTLRTTLLIVQAILCSIFGDIIGDSDNLELRQRIFKLTIIIVLIAWFWGAIIHRSSIEQNKFQILLNISYNCIQYDYIILSSLGFILSCIAGISGFEAQNGIGQYIENQRIIMKQQLANRERINQQIQFAENNRKKILVLLSGGLITFTIQLIWDIWAHTQAVHSIQCIDYYYGHSTILSFILGILKFISLSSLQISVYFAFYHMNKDVLIKQLEQELTQLG